MKKKDEPERRTSLRLPESLAKKIDDRIEETGMSFTEFVKRACQEKLERDAEPAPAYVTRAEFEALRRSVQNMEKNTENVRGSQSQCYAVADSRNTSYRK